MQPNVILNPNFYPDLTHWLDSNSPDLAEVRDGGMYIEVDAPAYAGKYQAITGAPEGWWNLRYSYEVLEGTLREQTTGFTGNRILTGEGTNHVRKFGTPVNLFFRADNTVAKFYIRRVALRLEVPSMARAHKITAVVQDGKGAYSYPSIHIPSTVVTHTDLLETAQQFATVIDALMTGIIRGITVTLTPDLPGGLGSLAPTSDVEEGALFLFDTADTGVFSKIRIPTFDETKMLSGSKDVDQADADVAAFITFMQSGWTATTSTNNVSPSEYRDTDITAIRAAYDAFQKSRKTKGLT